MESSVTCPSASRYRSDGNGSAPQFAPAPGCGALNTATVEGVFGKSGPPDRWVETLRNGAGEGERNVTAAALAGYLFRHDVLPPETMEILRCINDSRFKPPLDEAELTAVFESICKAELKRRGKAA